MGAATPNEVEKMSDQSKDTYESPSVEQVDTENAPAEVAAGDLSDSQ